MIIVCTLLFILMAHLEAASGEDIQEPTQPAHMTEYLQARDRCTFKPAKKMKGGCGIAVSLCEVETTLAEGSGYYRFTRIGPFSSVGGTQGMDCVGRLDAFGAAAGTYMTRAMSTVIEPYTGMSLSFPPIHLHHSHIFEDGYHPQIPSKMKEYMPWLVEGFTGASSSEECLRDVGGTGCFNVVMPPGLAMKRYANHSEGDYTVFMEDVRKMGSPPMSSAMEFGTFIVTKPNPALPPLKPAVPAKFAVGDDQLLHTYGVPYNTENYQVGTFYIAFKMEMTPYKMHQHGHEGDEVWTIRGTVEDLGVPEHLRAPILARGKGGAMMTHHPVNMAEGESLDVLKVEFEKSMTKAGIAWEKRTKRATRETENEDEKKNSFNSKSQSNSFFVPFDENDPQPMRSKPEILCKYYSVMEHITPDSIDADKAELHKLAVNGGHQIFTTEDAPFSRVEQRNEPFPTFDPNHDAIGPDGYVVPGRINKRKPSPQLVPEHDQYQNLFEGVQPGRYYRNPRSSLLEKDPKYTQCGRVVFEAGDYFTLMGLNAKRTNPVFDSAEFHDEPLKNQHTVFQAIAHLPDVPWF